MSCAWAAGGTVTTYNSRWPTRSWISSILTMTTISSMFRSTSNYAGLTIVLNSQMWGRTGSNRWLAKSRPLFGSLLWYFLIYSKKEGKHKCSNRRWKWKLPEITLPIIFFWYFDLCMHYYFLIRDTMVEPMISVLVKNDSWTSASNAELTDLHNSLIYSGNSTELSIEYGWK